MIRTSDTIVLPQRSTRADGIDPDIAKGNGERAIFSHPGPITTQESGRYISATNVRLVKAIAVVATLVDLCGDGCTLTFKKNNLTIGTLVITGYTQQTAFTTPVDLIAEIDTLWVVASGAAGAVENLTVFVSFVATPPL